MSWLTSLDELARRPDAPVLIVHIPDDQDGAAQLAAARRAYNGMVVIGLQGNAAAVAAIRGRDVVLWPWRAMPSTRAALRGLERELLAIASRYRVIAPPDLDNWLGPADLNGHEPSSWAKAHAHVVEAHELADLDAEWFGDAGPIEDPATVALLEETHERVSDFVPPMLEGADPPEPTNLFAEAPLPKLDKSMLPAALADFIFDQSEIIGSDPCILAVSTLVACAAVTSDSIKLQPKAHEHGWRESARLWGTFVGDPSVKKTPPLNRAVAHLRKIDMDFAEAGEESMRRYKIARKVYDAQEKRYIDQSAKNQPQGPLPDEPERPQMRRVIVQDATIEAVADVLADNPQGVMVLFDELSGFFGAMDAYRAQGSKDRSFWLESYNGGPRRVDRISREARSVPNLSTCILGGIQPAAMRAQAKNMVEDGLLQRFMIVIAQGGEAMGEDRRGDSGAAQAYRGILDWLVRCEGDAERPILLDDDARAVMFHVERKLHEFAKLDRLPLRMRYQLGKWSGLFCRLCLTYHAIECANLAIPVDGRIAGDIAERVSRFMFEYLFWHLKHFYEDLIGESTGALELAHRVARWVMAKKPELITGTSLARGVQSWRSAPWSIRRDAIDQLEVCGWIILGPKLGNGSRSWTTNPRIFSDFPDLVAEEIRRRDEARAKILGNAAERAESREYD